MLMTYVMKLTNNEKIIAAKQSSFVVTAFGGGEEWPVLYNIRGGGLAQLLYSLTLHGEGGVEKMAFFCYIICGRPLTYLQ